MAATMTGVSRGLICLFILWTAFLTFVLVHAEDVQQQGMLLELIILQGISYSHVFASRAGSSYYNCLSSRLICFQVLQ